MRNLLIALVLGISLAACGGQGGEEKATEETQTQQVEQQEATQETQTQDTTQTEETQEKAEQEAQGE